MEASEFIEVVEGLHGEARRRGLYFQICDDADVRGRRLTVRGKELIWFGSCSYLGLESHPEVLRGVYETTARYGSQFASSRGYVSAPPYQELEELLCRIFGGAVLLGQTTTLAHVSAFDVLATEKDAVVLDHQVHASVHSAVTLARSRGTHVEMVRHEHLERAIDVVARLAKTHRTVWFSTDGVTSMYGDLAPFALLEEILAVAPNVRLYVDDAHGMSWDGLHGRGSFLKRMPINERIVVATSLAKAFAGSGGALVFSSREEAERVRLCGSTMVFSGPLQPPILGATLGSARVHVTDELPTLQGELRTRTAYLNRRLLDAGLPLLAENDTPIFFIGLGLPRVAYEVAEALARDGLFANVSTYPSVPMKRAGIRIALTANHTFEEIDLLVASLARHVPRVLEEEGLARQELDGLFARAVVGNLRVGGGRAARSLLSAARKSVPGVSVPKAPSGVFECDPATLVVDHHRTIDEVDPAEWDAMLGTAATCSWSSMKLQEEVFQGHALREHNWDFHYFIVRRPDGRPVCATLFVVALTKDDMFLREHVSRAVEARREADPYFLCSVAATMGSGFSEGNHLYVDRSGPWRAGLHRLINAADAVYEGRKANLFVIRDLPDGDDAMDRLMRGEGFVKMPVMDRHLIDVAWDDEEGFHCSVSRKKRRHLVDMQARSKHLVLRVHGARGDGGAPLDDATAAHLQRLYENVARRKFRINCFPLPEGVVPALLESPAWEIVTLSVPPEHGGPADGMPIAWYGAHRSGDHYAPLLCGIDYDYLLSLAAYRQLLYQSVLRGTQLGARTIHLGMDASVEKRRLGARVEKSCIYLQARDHFNATLLREIAAGVGLDRSAPGSESKARATG